MTFDPIISIPSLCEVSQSKGPCLGTRLVYSVIIISVGIHVPVMLCMHECRYELPGIRALNFVIGDSLGGGGVASLRIDPQVKYVYMYMYMYSPLDCL